MSGERAKVTMSQLSAVIAAFPPFGTSERLVKITGRAGALMRAHGMIIREGKTPEASAAALIQRHSSDVKATPKGPDLFHRLIEETGRRTWTLRYPTERTYEIAGVEKLYETH